MKEETDLQKNMKLLVVGAIGIVFGDIGTSPLYALKSCFSISNLPITTSNIIGIISLFIWTLLLIVTAKYVFLVLKADNEGEGGILALSSLCSKISGLKFPLIPFVLGIIGASLFFADGILTPTISILGALEGLEVLFPIFSNYIPYIAIFLLTGLFAVQNRGTEKIGKFYGPIMIIWFVTLMIIGIFNIQKDLNILYAFNPLYALKFLFHNKISGLKAMGGGYFSYYRSRSFIF